MVEGARLESVYATKSHQGFESLSLRRLVSEIIFIFALAKMAEEGGSGGEKIFSFFWGNWLRRAILPLKYAFAIFYRAGRPRRTMQHREFEGARMRGKSNAAAIFTAVLTALLAAAVGAATIGAFSNADSDTAATANIKFYQHPGGLGAGGYDVVAYFEEAKAVQGGEAEADWGGLTWKFASEKNRDAFLEKPSSYLPQYGGHCAYGVAQGYLVRGDPKAWSIRDGKLYLNYSFGIRTAWLANADGLVDAAQKEWPKLNR